MGKKDYTRYSKRQAEKATTESVENISDVAENIQAKAETNAEPTTGVVTNCLKLNVREEPDSDGAIVCAINCDTKVIIDKAESTAEFYKICTESGIEGFCMKKFITIQ